MGIQMLSNYNALLCDLVVPRLVTMNQYVQPVIDCIRKKPLVLTQRMCKERLSLDQTILDNISEAHIIFA